MSVKQALTRKRARKEYETPDYAAMVRRVIRAHGRRVGDADPEDLAELIAMRAVLDEAIAEGVRGQRANGFSWAAIARGIGITRQGAQQQYGEVVEQLEHARRMRAMLAELGR